MIWKSKLWRRSKHSCIVRSWLPVSLVIGACAEMRPFGEISAKQTRDSHPYDSWEQMRASNCRRGPLGYLEEYGYRIHHLGWINET